MPLHRTTLLAILALFSSTSHADRPATSTAPTTQPGLKTQSFEIKILADQILVNEKIARIKLVRLPDGKITVKDTQGQETEHQIKGLWISPHETTWVEFYTFAFKMDLTDEEKNKQRREHDAPMERTRKPYLPPDAGWGLEGYPANCVTLHAAKNYCLWLSEKTGKKFRLPTEAEWEYACRAGGPPLKPTPKELNDLAWFEDNSRVHSDDNKWKPDGAAHPVGKKKPNPSGLYDMLGNVGEYVIRDPRSENGLIAGGTFLDPSKDISSDHREEENDGWTKNDPRIPPSQDWREYDNHNLGFRVVMEE